MRSLVWCALSALLAGWSPVLEAQLPDREPVLGSVDTDRDGSLSAGEIENALQAEHVPAHRLVTTVDAFEDPQLAAREHFISVEHGDLGAVTIENSRMRFSATPARVAAAGPTFGQHNQHVLTEILGLDDEEFTELLVEGVLA